MVIRWARRNLYWLLIVAALLVGIAYAAPGYARDRRLARQRLAPVAGRLLQTPVHVNFDHVLIGDAVLAVVDEARGVVGWNWRWARHPRPDPSGDDSYMTVTVHSAGAVPLEEAVYLLLATQDSGPYAVQTVWEDAGIVNTGDKAFFYGDGSSRGRSREVRVYDVADLASGLDETQRAARMHTLAAMIETDTRLHYTSRFMREPQVAEASVQVFNDKLVVVAIPYVLDEAERILMKLRLPE